MQPCRGKSWCTFFVGWCRAIWTCEPWSSSPWFAVGFTFVQGQPLCHSRSDVWQLCSSTVFSQVLPLKMLIWDRAMEISHCCCTIDNVIKRQLCVHGFRFTQLYVFHVLFLPRDPEIWHSACLRVWGRNCTKLVPFKSWREMFLQRPRVRFDGK